MGAALARQPIQKSSPPRRRCRPAGAGRRASCWRALAGPGGRPAASRAAPFDRITLDAANDNLVLNVRPIEAFPNRKLPDSLPKSGKLVIERIDEPGTTYELLWRAIVKIELFEQLILDEVNGLVASGQFDRAYEYFLHLENEKPDLPGLKDAYESYLYEEAKALQIAGDYQGALARLREICDRNPQRPGLDRALAAATDKLVEQSVAADQHWIAREYLDQLEKLYPQQPLIASWRQRLQEAAGEHLAAARRPRSRQTAGSCRRRSAACRPSGRTFAAPTRSGRRFFAAIRGSWSASSRRRPPRRPAASTIGRAADRAARRADAPGVGRAGNRGGKYICPVGEMKAQDLGRRLTFQLRSDIRSAGGSNLTGYDLARRLLAMADPAAPSYLQIWADPARRSPSRTSTPASSSSTARLCCPRRCSRRPFTQTSPARRSLSGPTRSAPTTWSHRRATRQCFWRIPPISPAGRRGPRRSSSGASAPARRRFARCDAEKST